MKKQHIESYKKFRDDLARNDRVSIKKFVQSYFSVLDWQKLKSVLDELLGEWEKLAVYERGIE